MQSSVTTAIYPSGISCGVWLHWWFMAWEASGQFRPGVVVVDVTIAMLTFRWRSMENATAVIWKTLRVVSAVATKYAEAAIRLRERFRVYLGLDFETAYNLIAFLVLRWFGSSGSIPHNPDAVVINRRTWLENTTIPIEALDRYLDAVAFRTDEIPAAFDALGAGMSFDEILP